MTLDTPRLDDRSFQDLVDDAKRFIVERCPSWTDHNVSDPGITLIEAVAWMTDLMLYRLNRVPERSYIKFLEMIGVTLRQPSPALVDVDFRLAAPQSQPVTVPARTTVSTKRLTTEPPVLFTTTRESTVKLARSSAVARGGNSEAEEDCTTKLGIGDGFRPFADEPREGDAVYLHFDQSVDNHLLLITARCARGEGHGIDTTTPPLRWDAWSGNDWVPCARIGDDGTGGFNYSGSIEIAVGKFHHAREIAGIDGYWIRCVVAPLEPGQTAYRSSPRIHHIEAATIGVTTSCVNASPVDNEFIATSTGVPGQEFALAHQPVVSIDGEQLIVEITEAGVAGESGEVTLWERRDNFADSGSQHRHFTLDATQGTLRFGPQVRLEDGSVQQFGMVPPKGATIRVLRYWYGGGRRGNVAAGAIQALRSSVPNVRLVRNRRSALGGVDAETVEEAKIRGPLEMRSRNRAVTTEDFEYLARKAAPQVRQVRCIEDEEQPGTAALRVLVVPDITTHDGRIELGDLVPDSRVLERIADVLDQSRLIGTRISVTQALYLGVSIDAAVEVLPNADPSEVRDRALAALYRYFSPVTGGGDGRGWPFGRSVRAGEAYGVLQRCQGVDVVTDLTLYAVDLGRGVRLDAVERGLALHPDELIYSFEHAVRVAS